MNNSLDRKQYGNDNIVSSVHTAISIPIRHRLLPILFDRFQVSTELFELLNSLL